MPASLFNFHVKQKTKTMIRLSDIQDALLHLVGWEQSYVPSDYLSDLTESERIEISGRAPTLHP